MKLIMAYLQAGHILNTVGKLLNKKHFKADLDDL